MRAIILAGGRATRLGPLTAQMNKGLVSVGQRPIIIHQLDLLRQAGVTQVVVVTSPESRLQVSAVLGRSLGGLEGMAVACVNQDHPHGPADAVEVGLNALRPFVAENTFVLMADTFIDEPLKAGDWIGVARAEKAREWCYFDEDELKFREAEVPAGSLVTIGAYCFENQRALYLSAQHANQRHAGDREAPMSTLLQQYVDVVQETKTLEFQTWLDVGDVSALAAAKRKRFITRETNHLHLEPNGSLIKSGRTFDIAQEAKWLRRKRDNLLFPRYLWDNIIDTTVDGEDEVMYAVEHVDLPTLAELYLYWPGVPSMWSQVLSGIIKRLDLDLWKTEEDDHHIAYDVWHQTMYVMKPTSRLQQWHGWRASDVRMIEDLSAAILRLNPDPVMVTGHGDLNWGNILYSLSTGNFKLVDPRGDDLVDLAYEFAKLRYSYRDGFSAITHDLFELRDDTVTVRFGPERDNEIAAMDEVMAEYIDLRLVTAVEATIFLSAAPLHTGDQQEAMYRQGKKLAKEVLNEERVDRAGATLSRF